MSNIATIPTNVPAHVSSIFAQLAQINKEATEGINTGFHPIIKTSGTRFVLVKDGEEKVVKSLELKVIVLRAKAGFEKRYFAEKYDPNSTEAKAPDCFSMDGVSPDASARNPQNSACAGCKWNAFGSGTDGAGNPGKGKACSDRKSLAVLYPNPDTKQLEVYGLSLPPASLKAFGGYVNTLTTNNIPLPAAFTTIGFDEKSTYPVMSFSYGGLLGENELAQIVPMIDGPEVKAIIDAKAPVISPVPPALAPKADSGFGFEEKVEKPKAVRAVKKVEAVETEEVSDQSDDDLAALLGIEL